MKQEDQRFYRRSAVAAGAAGGSILLWLPEIIGNGSHGISLLGLLLSIAAAILILDLWRQHRKAEEAHLVQEEELRAKKAALVEENQREALQRQKNLAEFRSSLAHGLRMPLSIIRGYAEMMADGMVTDPALQKEYLQKVVQRTHYMGEVLDRTLVDEEQIVQGELHMVPIDLLQFVRQAAADMQAAAAEKLISIQVVSKERTVPVEVDTYLLNQALFNLMENTLKYMGRPGTCTLLVLCQENRAILKVQDDGMGMPEEETARIFELHYQGSNSKAGQGRGLYLVKKIVEVHNGTIVASSAFGRGMSMTITLPLKRKNS